MISSLAASLASLDRVLVVSHQNPDGDALGSTLGLVHVLRDLGKDVWAHSAGPLPDNYLFLPGLDRVSDSMPDPAQLDGAVLLDCHEPRRAGPAAAELLPRLARVLVVDHHQGRAAIGDPAWVDSSYAATAAMVFDLARQAGWKVSPAAATCLFVGLQTDTGSFRYSNTTPRALETAAELVGLGADPWAVSQEVYATQPRRVRLLSRVLDNMVRQAEGQVAVSCISADELAALGASSPDLDQASEALRGLPGVEVAGLVKQTTGPDGGLKASLRSRGKVDVAAVALAHGGGGHHNAAGMPLKGTLEEASQYLLKVLGQALAGARS